MTREEKQQAMAADRWLRQYLDAEHIVRTCKRQRMRLVHLAHSLPSPALDASPVISGRVSDVVGEAATALAEADRELAGRIRECMLTRRKIQAAIRCVPEARDQTLLELRYIEGMSYPQIAGELDYYGANNVHRHLWKVLSKFTILE